MTDRVIDRGPVVVSAAVCTVMMAGLAACSGHGDQSRATVALPPATADSQQVLTAYLKAAVGKDCTVTRGLTASSTWAWCDSPRMTAYKNVGKVVSLTAAEAGRAMECYPLTVTTTAGASHGVAAGTRPWTLCFGKTSQGYRLVEQAMH